MKHSAWKWMLVLSLIFSVFAPLSAVQATAETLAVTTIEDGVTPQQMAEKILGVGVQARKIGGGELDATVFKGAQRAGGLFSGGESAFGVKEGIILSTGDAKGIVGTNSDFSVDNMNNTAGDADLAALVGIPANQTNDAAVLEFEFKLPSALADKVNFRFVMTSEEYPEYLNFFDTMGLFINGQNVALVPNTNPPQAVSVGNVNHTKNATYYKANHSGLSFATTYPTTMDGMTTVFTAEASITPNAWNTIKLAIADKSDFYYDSNVLIEADSLKAPQNIAVNSITATGFTVSWDPVSNVTGYDVYNGTTFLGSSSSTSFTATDLTEYTEYSINVKSRDAAGNQSPPSPVLTVRTADVTKPTAPTDLIVDDKTDTTIDISWTASTDGGSGVELYKIYNGTTEVGTTSATNYEIDELTQSTTYSISVIAQDNSDNLSDPTSLSVKTKDGTAPSKPTITSPLTPPGTTGPPNLIGTTNFMLTWTASIDNAGGSGVKEYEIYKGEEKVGTTKHLIYDVTGLTANTAYSMNVKAVDHDGNVSEASDPVSVTTLTSPQTDVTAPSRPGTITVSNKTATGFKITWIASTDPGTGAAKSGLAGYEVYLDGPVAGAIRPIATPTYTFTGLLPETTYTVQVRAVDKAGNRSAYQPTAPLSVTTTKDLTAPSAPNNLMDSEKDEDSFTLTWNPSTDNIGVTGYEILRDGVVIGTSGSTTYMVTGLTAGKTYKMTVKAFDANNNKSVASGIRSVTINSDNTDPIAPTGLEATEVMSTSFMLGWNPATDNVAVTGYNVYVNDAKKNSANITDTSFEVNLVTKDTTYNITVTALDAANNESLPSEVLVVKTSANSEPPQPPEELVAYNITENNFMLEWAHADDDVGIKEYEIYKDGNLIKKVAAPAVPIEANTPDTMIGSTVGDDAILVKDTTYVMTIVAVDLDDNKSEPSDPLPVKAENSSNGPRITVKKVKGSTTNTAATIEYRLGQVIPTDDNPTPAAITQAKMRIQLRSSNGTTRYTVAPDNALTPVNTPLSKNKKVSIPVSGSTITDGTYYVFMQATHPTDNTKKTIALKAIKVDKTAPVISNITKSNDIYSPDGSLFSTISYTINEASTVNIKINDAKGATIRTLSTKAPKKAGSHTIVWNGKNKSNVAVPDGLYTVMIEATNRVKLKTTNTSLKIYVETKRPTITKTKVSPTPLKLTTTTATTTISYTLSEKAKVTIKIYDKNEAEVRTLLNEATLEAGARTVTWNGKNGSVPSAFVTDGTYQIRIDAADIPPATVKGTSGSDVSVAAKQAVTSVLAVVTDGKNLPTVTNVSATDDSITSGSESTSVSYTLSESAKVTVQVLNAANSVIRTLDNAVTRAAATHTVVWNGRNASGVLVAAGNYKIKITAIDSTAKKATAEQAITVTAAPPPPTP